MKGLFRGRSGQNAGGPEPQAEVLRPIGRTEALDDFEDMGLAWIWASDSEGRLTFLSSGALATSGLTAEEVIGTPLVQMFEQAEESLGERPFKFQVTAKARLANLVVRPALAGAARCWWQLTGVPKIDANGTFVGYRGSLRDITVEYQRQLEDDRLAEHDTLTGLYNRHRMGRRLENLLAAYRTAKRSCALMMLDLDRFKLVNDTMGHAAGDALLRQVAERLRAVIGDKGEIGRLGGDEFQVILPDMDDRGSLGTLAERVIQIVSQPYPLGEGQRAIIGTSVGIAIAPYDGIEPAEVVHASDLALYAAKNGGRGQFRFYSADLKDEREERQLLLDDLREALTGEQLQLHYQPVVRTADNVVVGFEALMRWEHPERGSVSPGLFIPLAEESSLVVPLGEWAIRRACRDAVEWPSAVRVAVNVSAVQFAHKGFPDRVAEILEATGLAAERLELELTESIFMGDSEEIDETFRALKKLGVRLALDDFGTGYSSLSYLRSAPFDKLKVDKTFVDSCTSQDQNSAKIIAAIIGLSDAIGMETTVEGVEAFDQLDLVISKGARFVQGWIYAKAMPHAQVLEGMASGEFRIEPEGPDRYRAERRSVFRRVGVIHGDHRYDAVLRDLSKTGARVEGLLGVPVGTGLVLDLGGGQLAVCNVIRSVEASIAVEFETPLVSDGAGGLCTRHRVSPYALAAAGMPLGALPPGNYPLVVGSDSPASKPAFLQVATGSRAA